MPSESAALNSNLPRADGLWRHPRLTIRALSQGFLLTVILSFLITVIPGVRSNAGYSVWLDGVWQSSAFFSAAIICTLRVRTQSKQRAFWYLINAALYCDAIAQTLWFWLVGQADAGQASPADILWITYYILILFALGMLIHGRVRGLKNTVIADAAVVCFGAAAAGSAAMSPYLKVSPGGFVYNLVNIGYPILDLAFMVTILGFVTVFRWRPPPGVWVLFAALTVLIAADLLFEVEVAGADYFAGGFGDGLYVTAATVAALGPGWRRKKVPYVPRWLPTVFPVIATVAAVVVLLLHDASGASQIPRWLALAAVAAAGARLSLAYSETRRSADLSRLAHTDDLTSLLNRRGFFRAHRGLVRPRPTPHAIFVLDFDRFKDINDNLGHHSGDDLLRASARRIVDAMPAGSLIARFGGDEFVISVPVSRRPEAEALANSLFTGLTRRFDLAGLDVRVGVSIGIAMCPDHGTTTTALLRHADLAMYQSKRSGSGPAFYSIDTPREETISSGRSGLQLLAEFRTAIDEQTLDVHYMPIHNVANGSIDGAEALLRWHHPDHGLLGPGLLLPLAIRNGLMKDLTHSVLACALQEVRQWREVAHDMSVSVNVSPSILEQDNLVDSVLNAVHDAGLPPSALVVEITEDNFVGDYSRTRHILDDLRSAGVRISLDDFGSGHSILEYLRELTIDELKLDRSFIQELASDARTAAIVSAITSLAHTLNVRVVAEGVETAEGEAELRGYGCDLVQGNYYSVPLPAASMREYVRAHFQTQ
ncbi:putative bifunctional diguanylate cyclase/phosphodiesterase [Smaragdicoccus niigatensis]|uniref:putative bifunctional diguanylate cyclase/phosphodiesterase n=1 Tax=Smaragdicoccus niigatensis TaxID=359359 RepID=UPI0003774B3B|nr:bifunctional diguanylate cyclase/phosphodiesterase [Smaragdicoccus niigatensis]